MRTLPERSNACKLLGTPLQLSRLEPAIDGAESRLLRPDDGGSSFNSCTAGSAMRTLPGRSTACKLLGMRLLISMLEPANDVAESWLPRLDDAGSSLKVYMVMFSV